MKSGRHLQTPADDSQAAAGGAVFRRSPSRRAGAPWEAFLPVVDGEPILSVGADLSEVSGPGLPWDCVHVCDPGEEEPGVHARTIEARALRGHVVRVKRADVARGRYCAVALGPGSHGFMDPRSLLGLVKAGGAVGWLGSAWSVPRRSLLERCGFDRARSYAVLPPGSGKIVLPISEGGCARAGLDLYTPGRWRNRVLVRMARWAAATGSQALLGWRQIVVARAPGHLDGDAFLLGWLSQALGCRIADATVYVAPQKLTLQLLTEGGRTSGVAKFARNPCGDERVRHEAEVLGLLARVKEVRGSVPCILAAGEWKGRAVQVQSALRAHPGRYSASPTARHVSFLSALACVDRREMTLRQWHCWPELLRWSRAHRLSSAQEAGAVRDALRLGAIGYDAVKHLVLCRIERRPPKLDLDVYPYLPRAWVATTCSASYMSLLEGGPS